MKKYFLDKVLLVVFDDFLKFLRFGKIISFYKEIFFYLEVVVFFKDMVRVFY